MKKLTALLGLAAIQMHNANIFGTGKNYAKLDEEQLQKIEDALGETSSEEATQTIADLQAQVSNLQASENSVQEAVTTALQINGLALEEGQTVMDAITLLGTKCHEYGTAKTTHNIPGSDGKDDAGTGEQLIDGYMDPNDEHNKYLNK